MSQHILEGSKLTVRARIADGEASTKDIEFVFFKDKTEFQRVSAQLPSVKALGDAGWVEASVDKVPDVDATKKNYELTYQVVIPERTITDLPAFIVWPARGKIVVKPATTEHKDMKGFRFRVKQNSVAQGADKRVTLDDGSYEFDLIAGHAFTIEALPPYEITSWVTQDGHEVECKATMKFEADFFDPQAGAVKQYVNITPPDLTVPDLGRNGDGPTVIVKLGVKDDPGRPDGEKFGKPGLIVHFRATFGPKVGNGGIEKSTRNDPAYPTEIKQELEVKQIAGPDADNVYKGKIELKADGTGAVAEMKVYLGLAGGDTCKLEIAGTDKFLNDATTAADATLTFTNWRKSYYELMAPDFYAARELDDVTVSGVTHRDFPAAALNKLKALGDSVFIEYAWAHTVVVAQGDAIKGSVLSKRFLEINGTEDPAFILTDYTNKSRPKGYDWQRTHRDLTNFVKLCDHNYYWELDPPGAFPNGRKRFRDTTTTVDKNLTVHATHGGYFIPRSGLSKDAGGTKSPSVWLPDGSGHGIAWKADIDPDNYMTVIDAIVEDRPPAVDGLKTRTVTITESNQNPAACNVDFTKIHKRDRHISTDISATDKARIEAWVEALFDPDELRANGNKVTITISGEAGPKRRQARFDGVKRIVRTKLNALRNTHSIAVHPGIDDTGNPREGVLSPDEIDMTRSTRKIAKVKLPAVNPTDPGSFVGVASNTKCPIKLDTYIEVHDRALGLCEGSRVLACFSKANAAIDVCVTMHEMGHSYCQTVYDPALPGANAAPLGMPTPKTVNELESVARYKLPGKNKGQTYIGKQHSGEHCAYGLSDSQKGSGSYRSAGIEILARCIMFGSGGYNRTFCPQCIDMIRGVNLTVIPVVGGT